ncbi:MAG: secretin N-terminal domain-containing protein [Spirochaetota bacterium]
MQQKKILIYFVILCMILPIRQEIVSQPKAKNKKKLSARERKRRARAGRITRGRGGASFTADWRDTDLKDFLKGMAAIIGKNILIDESMKSQKITIISQKRIPVKNAYSFLKSVLESQGYGVVEENDLIKVIKIKQASSKSSVVRVGRFFPSESTDQNEIITQIVPIYDASARQLEPILKQATSTNTQILVYKETNTLVITGLAGDIQKLLNIVNRLDQKSSEGPGSTASAGDIHIYTLEYNQADKLAKVLVKLNMPKVGLATADKKKNTRSNKKIPAVAHEDSNSIIVTANKEEWQEIKKIIKVLDLPRKQVLLEVLIVELISSDLNDFGIDWRLREGAYGQYNSGLAAEGGVIDANGRPTQVNTLSGFSLGFLQSGRSEIIGILNANATNENFNVLSAPQVLTIDNQKATINVGQDVPVRTQRRNAGLAGANAVTVDNFEYRPTGIKLEFTPHVNKNDMITLELDQEVKSVAGLVTQGGNPTFNKRNINTTITVENTQTVVIGGLISNDKQKSISKIPVIGDIPLIGRFFRRTTTQIKKTNLMVFLTPHILDTREKADKMTFKKKKEQERESRNREQKIR